MKKIFSISIVAALFILRADAQTPATVTFKPGADIGADAFTFKLDGDCVPSDGSIGTMTPGNVNYGNKPLLCYNAWTFSSVGCTTGWDKSYVKFVQLNTIPAEAIITNATLKLYGIPSNTPDDGVGNSYYPGSGYTATNEGWLRKVTSNWEEATITANSEPTSTSAGEISVPTTGSQWNWNWEDSSANLVNMVQSWVSNPNENYGFVLQLQEEDYYREVLFASSDHANSALWPELTVTYIMPDCNADFTYSINTANPNQIDFQANSVYAGWSYSWAINGQNYSGSNVTYAYSGGAVNVCLTVTDPSGKRCQKCTTVDANTGISSIGKNAGIASMILYPNPSASNWNINMQSTKRISIVVNICDITGRILSSKAETVNIGGQNLVIPASDLSSGMYMIELKDINGRILAKAKVVKE